MTGGEKVLIVGVAGIAAIAWYKNRQATSSLIPPGSLPSTTSGVAPTGLDNGGQLAPSLSPILALPGASTAYQVLSPAYSTLVKPITKVLNSTVGTVVNKVVGQVTVVTTKDVDPKTGLPTGTVTKTVAPQGGVSGWESKNIGQPISHAGTSVVHFIGSIL